MILKHQNTSLYLRIEVLSVSRKNNYTNQIVTRFYLLDTQLLKGDLCKTPPFAQSQRQAQILTRLRRINPRNIQYIPAVKIIAFFHLDQNWTFFKGLER
jgi:hypothetical protein